MVKKGKYYAYFNMKEREKERESKRGVGRKGKISSIDKYRTKNECVKIVLLLLKLFSL